MPAVPVQDCHDKDPNCQGWADSGECGRNGDFMLSTCAFSCGVCDVSFKPACKRDPAEAPAAVGGTIDETFRRALDRYSQYGPRVLHRDPWIVEFRTFLTPFEADHLLKTAGHKFDRSLAGDGVTPVRTSSTSWCNVEHCLADPLVQTIRERISNVTESRGRMRASAGSALPAGTVLPGASRPELSEVFCVGSAAVRWADELLH